MKTLRDKTTYARRVELEIRRLHIRWCHAPVKCMKDILVAAGAPTNVIESVDNVVDTCKVCRSWERPSPHNVTSARLSSRSNENVQVDLLFLHDDD